jgi:hypothetical protein
MSKSRRLALIEELKEVHDKYLTTLSTFNEPEERKTLIEESIQAFDKHLKDAENGELQEEKLEFIINAIKTSDKQHRYPKGFCSIDCTMACFKAQNLVIASAMASKLPPEVVFALVEMTTNMLTETLLALISLANSDQKPWETKKKAHDILEGTAALFNSLSDTVKAGRVMTVKLPSVDKSKYKQFMN